MVPSEPVGEGSRTVPTRESDYRPHLDGLRAVAVYLVVAFHAGLGLFVGGFVGVDVFFVLSGYLVTTILLRDVARRGRIELPRFYARRYRRLLPAAFVTLTVTAIAFVLVASAREVADSIGDFRAAFLYYANWHFISQSNDYFAADINRSPVIHFWSLAVEEQFYLLWPLLLSLLLLIARPFRTHSTTAVRALVALAAVASALRALQLAGPNLNRAYYGTDTRGYQLLAGALLALTPSLFALGRRWDRPLRVLALAALGAIVVVATSATGLATIDRGIATTVATVVLIVAIENARGAAITRTLSQPIATYLGRVSYGTYLWHWPVIVVLTRETSWAPLPVFAFTCVVGTALAAASYHALELRIRLSAWLDAHRVQVIASGLTLSLVGGLLVAPGILDRKHGTTLVATGLNGSAPVTVDWRAAQKDIPPLPSDCTRTHPAGCTIVHGRGRRVLLLGDSNARMYIPTFAAIAKREDLTLSVLSAPLCPWQQGLHYFFSADICRAKQAEWYGGLVSELAPDIVVVVDRPMDDPASATIVTTDHGAFSPGDPGWEAILQTTSAASLARLRAGARKVVIVEPIPIASKEADPLNCLSSATSLKQCIYQANAKPTPLELFYRRHTQPGQVWSVDFDSLICPRLPECDPVVDGIVVKRDADHITGTYAAHISDEVDALLRRAGALD